MGACMSTGGLEVSEDEKRRNREVEKELREVSGDDHSQPPSNTNCA